MRRKTAEQIVRAHDALLDQPEYDEVLSDDDRETLRLIAEDRAQDQHRDRIAAEVEFFGDDW